MLPNSSSSLRRLCSVREDTELHHSYTDSVCCESYVNNRSGLLLTPSDSGACRSLDADLEADCGLDFTSDAIRQRSGSVGIKNFFALKRNRNKSGDSSKGSPTRPTSPPNDLEKGSEKSHSIIKSLFRQRSLSDATAVKNTAMRRRHISFGSPTTGAPHSNAVSINNNVDQIQRERATSWGAKERLAMCKNFKVSGYYGCNNVTPMSQLLAGGTSPVNRKVEKFSPGQCGDVPQFTGKAFIWQRACSVDETMTRRHWNTADLMETEFEDLVKGDPAIFIKFMKAHKCYDVIPTSAKLVVFDTKLSVKKAFYALVYNSVRAAPLWNSSTQEFVGMLTISDFILILTKYYTSSTGVMTDLEEHKISTWRDMLSERYRTLVAVSPDTTLYDAVRTLICAKVHRLPIVDPSTGNPLYILTHKRILKFLYIFMRNLPQPTYMDLSLEDLQIGTYTNIATVTKDTRLIDALMIFVKRHVSALPVVNDDNQVENVFAKFDVLNLAADKAYNNLEVSISQALNYRRMEISVYSCHRTDSFKSIIEKIVKAEVHRLVVVDRSNRLEGIISLSDILSYLLREDRHLSSSLSSVSCSVSAGEDQMDVFASEPLEAV